MSPVEKSIIIDIISTPPGTSTRNLVNCILGIRLAWPQGKFFKKRHIYALWTRAKKETKHVSKNQHSKWVQRYLERLYVRRRQLLV